MPGKDAEDPSVRSVAGDTNYGLVVTGGSTVQINSFPAQEQRARSLASERQGLFFAFFRQALKQAETTFRLSVTFMSFGAAIVIAGGILALFHAGGQDLNYLPLVTSLSGALIATGGGALAIHSNRARRHLTEQANKLDRQVDKDHQIEIARILIDQVQDADLKDRLRAMTAMRALNMEPSPETAANSVLPGQSGGKTRRSIGHHGQQ